MIPLQEPKQSPSFALFNLAFRPFFLFGAASALLLLITWLVLYSQGGYVAYYSSALYWHGHEMLFGFTLAIVTGFLLTAVRNWTSIQTVTGTPLALLAGLWLAGRLLPLIPAAPGWIVAAVDLAFAPTLAIAVAMPIIRARNYRNLLFIPILALFFAANLLVHLEILGVTENTALTGLHLALYLVVLLITVLGGRVIPFFTERGVTDARCHRYSWVEKAIVPMTVGWAAAFIGEIEPLQLPLSLAMLLLNLIRLYGWFHPALLRVPLVWVLHAGYLFVTLGYGLSGLASLELVSSSIAIHGFAAGGIGLMTLGMMARVSLGHTGRPLKTEPIMMAAFVLMLLAALVRVSVTTLPLPYLAGLHLSGSLWSLAWLLFLVHYLPILIKPRADGAFG